MPKVSKTVLKSYFNDGDVPNEEDYIDLVDTMGDMDQATYDTNADGTVNAADAAPWTGITGKPSTYPPSTHQHGGGDITSPVDNANAAPWTGITGKPSTYPPDAHLHDSDYHRKDADIINSNDIRIAGGLYVGGTGVNPAASELYAGGGNFYIDSLGRINKSAPVLASVYHNASQALTNGSWTTLTFNSEYSDAYSMHDPLDATKLSAPLSGWYDILGEVEITANVGGSVRFARIVLNATTVLGMASGTFQSSISTVIQVSARQYLAATHYVQLSLFVNVAGLSCLYQAGFTPRFSMVKLT